MLQRLFWILTFYRVCRYLKLDFDPQAVDAFIAQLLPNILLTEPEIHIQHISDDPDDNRVLECTVAAGANYIISGDKHLLKLKQYQGISILTATEFLRLIGSGLR